jgi:hypothetical protein
LPDNFDRRSFIRRTSMGAAAVGALTVAGGVFGDVASANAATAKPTPHEVLDGSDVIAHVVDARTGEISILAGTQEITLINRDLAQQLVRATR